MTPRQRNPEAAKHPLTRADERPTPTAGGSYVDDGSGPKLVEGSQTVPADIVHRARVLMAAAEGKGEQLTQEDAIAKIVAFDTRKE
jgi:hypothetical protein